ncbi:type II toxin-antitoxin system Phd/YefM family antitoxin [bacterium]|nr:type II toxin-antitoxin system Phd/YefM family antitoxin [bacterium]
MGISTISGRIIPISEFKQRSADLVKRLHSERDPLILTQNGRAAAVLVSPEEYDRLTRREEYLEAVAAGVAQADSGQLLTTSQVLDTLGLSEKEVNSAG